MPREKRDPAARKPSPYERAGSEAVNATSRATNVSLRGQNVNRPVGLAVTAPILFSEWLEAVALESKRT